jgi:opacity protein-like surface antigen
MRKVAAALLVIGSALLMGGTAFAQGSAPRLEIGVMPAGVTFFSEADNGEPSFKSYALVGTVTVNASRFIGVEGEVGGSVGIEQDLDLRAGRVSAQPPHMLTYMGNVLIYPGGRDHRAAPYVAAGAGGITLFQRAEVAVPDNTTLFAGSVGGGVKVDVTDGIGIRVDYRFMPVASKNDAPVFFGRETRYGHRVAAGLTINVGR